MASDIGLPKGMTPDAAYIAGMADGERIAGQELYNALKVLLGTEVVANVLRVIDPKALEQAATAVAAYESERATEREPEWVVDLYIPFTCVPEGAESDTEAEALARDAFIAEGLYERLLEALEGTVFTRSDSEWRTEVGC